MAELLLRPNKKNKRIYCISNNKYYTTMAAAAADLNLDPSAVSKAVRGIAPHASGYVFRYAPKNFTDDQIAAMREELISLIEG